MVVVLVIYVSSIVKSCILSLIFRLASASIKFCYCVRKILQPRVVAKFICF